MKRMSCWHILFCVNILMRWEQTNTEDAIVSGFFYYIANVLYDAT